MSADRRKKISKKSIPQPTLSRLPYYLRALYVLDDEGKKIASSADIAELVGSNSAQARKDLSCLGEHGHRGVGYNVKNLISVLERFLGVSRKRRVILVGVGRLGSALLRYKGLKERGFEVVAAFDVDSEKIGKSEGGVPIYDFNDIEDKLDGEKIDIAMITVPAKAAQEAVDRALQAGVRGILNFVPVPVKVPENVPYRTVCIAAELQLLSYYLKGTKYGAKGKKKRKENYK